MISDLDIENHAELVKHLRMRGLLGSSEVPPCRSLAGGVSNRTVWVGREGGDAWVLKQALPKLRVQEDWFADPARVHREVLGLQWLGRLAPPGTIPEFVFEDEGVHLVAMRAVPEPHVNWKTRLLSGDLRLDDVRQFGLLLGTIHRRSAERAEEVEPVFADRQYFECLRLDPYYRFTASRHAAARDFFMRLIVETAASRTALVHGDYSPKNILIHDGRLILLDHEVIHWGDPAFDLGFALTHLLSKANHLANLREPFLKAADALWDVYREAVGVADEGASLQARAVRHTLACLLARVDGRSPLEYLDNDARQRQRAAVLKLVTRPPVSVAELTERFGLEL